MTYKQITQLPDSVKNNLPKHAQEIYKEAFNSAEESSTARRTAPTAWPGASWSRSTRKVTRATGSRKIANTPVKREWPESLARGLRFFLPYAVKLVGGGFTEVHLRRLLLLA